MAIRTSSSASSRNRKKRINRSSRSPESMSPRWSRDSSRSRNRPSGGRGDGSCGLGGGPPGGGLPGDESPPGGGGSDGGGSDGGGGGGRPETGPGAGSCWGMRLYAPCSLRMYRLYTLSLPFRQEFFPQMDEPCQMCRPFHLALLFRLQKRPQGVQQLHGGAVPAAEASPAAPGPARPIRQSLPSLCPSDPQDRRAEEVAAPVYSSLHRP